jgi:hypothetical protein
MRWRGAVRVMARLRTSLAAEQLATLRYESMVQHAGTTATAVSAFVGDKVAPVAVRAARREGQPSPEPGAWRRQLTRAQLTEIESVAGPDLRRVGYSD